MGDQKTFNSDYVSKDYVSKEVFSIEIGHIKGGITDIKKILEDRREAEIKIFEKIEQVPVINEKIKGNSAKIAWIWGFIIVILGIIVKVAFTGG